MVLTSKVADSKQNDFFTSAILSILEPMLKPEEALFLTRALIAKQSTEQLLEFLNSPIIVIDGEKSVLVDNKFIKRQLLENNQIEVLEQLHKAKIIICNCNNISVKGLDVIYLLGNTVRIIAPDEEQVVKKEVFVAKDNKIITTVNTSINFSINNSFKSMLHSTIDNMKNTKIIHLSSTSKVPQTKENKTTVENQNVNAN